jgi:hypothetical protein
MADSALPVTWDQFYSFIDRISDVEDQIKAIQTVTTQSPSNGMISTYQTPWIVQNYYLPYSNRESHQLPPGSPSGPGSLNKIATNIDVPGLTRTTVKNGMLQKTAVTSESGSANAPIKQRTAGLRTLATVDDELRPVLIPGQLTDLETHYPMLMVPNGLPRAFRGRFNLSYQGPAKGIAGHWEYFSEGRSGDTNTGSSEELAHTNLGGQGHWDPEKSQPSADDVHELRERFRASGADDVTAGIDIGWVPNQNLPKERRDQLLKSLSSDREDKQTENKSLTGNGSKQRGNSNKNTNVGSRLDKKRKLNSSGTGTDDQKERTLGVDKDPNGNTDAMLPHQRRSQARAQSMDVTKTQPTQRPARHASTPGITTDPISGQESGRRTSRKKSAAHQGNANPALHHDADERFEQTNGKKPASSHSIHEAYP